MKKAEQWRIMLSNCHAGEDSWESLAQQEDQTSPSYRKSVLNIHWKVWCWNWRFNILSTWAKSWLIGKDLDAGKDWRQEEKGMIEDEMVAWHHWLDGCEFEQALGVGAGQGSLACCSTWGYKELHMTERLNELSIQLARQWHPTPVLLPGKSHGWRSLVGCSLWGC